MENIDSALKNVDNYINSDDSLKSHRSVLEAKINSNVFEKLINANQGLRKIHYIDYNGSKIPMRLLSTMEGILIKHETCREFAKFPEFMGGENNPIFNKLELIKTLSWVTSPSPELVDKAYLDEEAVGSLPDVAFAYLINEYQKLNTEYNLAYHPDMDEDISYILSAIFDGAPLNEKTLVLLNGLTSSMLLQIIIRLCNVIIKLEENTQFITLLQDSIQSKTEESLKHSQDKE